MRHSAVDSSCLPKLESLLFYVRHCSFSENAQIKGNVELNSINNRGS